MKIYYTALPQWLSFELGDVDVDGTAGADATWRTNAGDPAQHATGSIGFNLPKSSDAKRAGYTLIGWIEAATVADGKAVSNLVGSAANEWINANSGSIIVQGSGSYRMPNHDTTLYAVWQPDTDVEFNVEVWVLQGDGSIEHLSAYDKIKLTGTVDDTVDYSDPTAPFFSYVDSSSSTITTPLRSEWAIPAVYGYELKTGVWANENLVDTIKGDGSTVIKLYYEALYDPASNEGSTFFIEHYLVNVDSNDKMLAPVKYGDTDKVLGMAGVYVKVDEAAADQSTAGTSADPWLYAYVRAIDGYDYIYNFNAGLPEGSASATNYVNTPSGRVLGHADNDTQDGALVLKLYYKVHAYTLTLDPGDGTITQNDTSGDYVTGKTVVLPGVADMDRMAYTFTGWKDTADGTVYPVNVSGIAASFTMPGRDTTLQATWTPKPVVYKVYHFKVLHDGTLVLYGDAPESFTKYADTTAVVADYDAASTPDVETYITDDGVANPNKTADQQSAWKGYKHIYNGSGVYNGSSYTTKESGNVQPDGSLELYVFYEAQLVDYKVVRWKVTGDGKRVAIDGYAADGVTPNYIIHTGYVDNTAVVDNTSAATGYVGNSAGTANANGLYNFEYDSKDDVTGYTYRDGTASAAFVYNADWNTKDEGTIVGDAAKMLVLELYYEANPYTLRIRPHDHRHVHLPHRADHRGLAGR